MVVVPCERAHPFLLRSLRLATVRYFSRKALSLPRAIRRDWACHIKQQIEIEVLKSIHYLLKHGADEQTWLTARWKACDST